jgi:hypothetical protein
MIYYSNLEDKSSVNNSKENSIDTKVNREITSSIRRCVYCGEPIDFRRRDGKNIPINLDGSLHSCFQFEAGIPSSSESNF